MLSTLYGVRGDREVLGVTDLPWRHAQFVQKGIFPARDLLVNL
jgi:hypothetical protein